MGEKLGQNLKKNQWDFEISKFYGFEILPRLDSRKWP